MEDELSSNGVSAGSNGNQNRLHISQIGESKEVQNAEKGDSAATFEDAIAATGFGKYNLLLMVVLFFPTISQTFETGNLSYVLPIAQCDLDLSLEDIGVIMSMTYVGQVCSGFFWGYLSDAYGRKKVLVYGYLLNALFATLGAFSTSPTLLMVSKVCGGLVISGPFSAAIVHTSEFYCKEYRSKAKLIWGMLSSVANIILPLLAWVMLPNRWDFVIAGYEFHSWNLFLLLCAMVPLIGGICYLFIPESPKYLMSSGNNRKALKVFQKVYTINTGKANNTFPHVSLVGEGNKNHDSAKKISASELMINGLKELGVLLHKPYISRIILACTVSFSLSISTNTLKSWLPQIFQAINDYQSGHNGTSADICTMLNSLPQENRDTQQICTVNTDNASVYINSTIVAITRLVICLIAVAVIKHVGSKKLVLSLTFATALLSGGMYFSRTSAVVLITSSASSALGSVADMLFINITVEMFPTSLRTIAIALHQASGRVGTLIGNVAFPLLLTDGCTPPFLFITLFPLAAVLLTLLYPNVDNKSLI